MAVAGKLALMCAFCALCGVDAHASMIMPPSRNSVDADIAPWKGADLKHWPETGWIEPYNCRCTNGTSDCAAGQSCFWFSQGCTIGCDACDGNGTRVPNFNHCPGQEAAPTINDPKWRTVNQGAEAGSLADFTKYHPWRAPGKAPVFDACGMAGGVDHEVFNAGAFNTTVHPFGTLRQGDLGSKVLPRRPSGTVWHRGGTAKARWQNTAEHGGGYQYRLCPANEPLTEACFQRMPLRFATPDSHRVVFADPSKDVTINATVVPHAVTGTGDWMVNPLPYGNEACSGCCDRVMPEGQHCTYKCPGCGAPTYAADGACPTDCASYPGLPHGGAWDKFPRQLHDDVHTFAIEDALLVPSDIPAGEYVLGWRWDCEATSQVWSTCADITIA